MVSNKPIMILTCAALLVSSFIAYSMDREERECKAEYDRITSERGSKVIYPWTQWAHSHNCYKYMDKW